MPGKIALLSALFAAQVAAAQMKEGKVVYESTQQLNFQFKSNGPEIPNLPKTITKQYELLFANNQSLWQPLPDMNQEANQMAGPSGGPMISMFRIGGADAVTYHNFETGKRVSERELSAKNYLVEEPIGKLTWKLTEESKIILGHRAFKATADRISTRTMVTMENGETSRKQVPDTSKIVAWFAADIPVPAGPDFQGQLPGLILELDINNGRTVFKALELSPKVNASAIKAPSRGKKISAEDYAKEQSKMMDQMMQNRGGRGNGDRITITAQQ
jgi:GLPGLI family protein